MEYLFQATWLEDGGAWKFRDYVNLFFVNFKACTGNFVSKNNSFFNHKVTFLPVKDKICILATFMHFIEVFKTVIEGVSKDGKEDGLDSLSFMAWAKAALMTFSEDMFGLCSKFNAQIPASSVLAAGRGSCHLKENAQIIREHYIDRKAFAYKRMFRKGISFLSYGAKLRLGFHFHVEKRLEFLKEVDRKRWGKESANTSGVKFILRFDSSFVEFIQPCFWFTHLLPFAQDIRTILALMLILRGRRMQKRQTTSKHGTYVFGESLSGQENESEQDPLTSENITRRENGSIVSITELDCKNLNRNDIKDMYLLCVNGKVEDYIEIGSLWSLSVFIRSTVIWERVHDFQLGVESYQQKVNLATPTITFPGIEKYKVFCIVFEPVYGIIYKNNKKEKGVTRHQEIHKFCDAILKKVLEGLESYNNNVKHGYVTPSHSKEDVEYLDISPSIFRNVARDENVLLGFNIIKIRVGKITVVILVRDKCPRRKEYCITVRAIIIQRSFSKHLRSKGTLNCKPNNSVRMTLEGKKTWWLRLGARLYDSWKLQGDVEELWDELTKLGLGLRCCLVSMVPRLNLVPKEVIWPLGRQVESLRCLCAFRYDVGELWRSVGAWLGFKWVEMEGK
uniref:Proteasome subunit alpha type-1 n=1 Tax=Tanacetum cinerariifolium TaxID=118510 RepID=A0A699H2Z1_TANCI|nr:proteasome subunit alpha type-1 [Tanacetum cinerariifolium]